MKEGREKALKSAYREARRDASGTGDLRWPSEMTPEQLNLAKGLQPTFIRDAEALEVLRVSEEARGLRGLPGHTA